MSAGGCPGVGSIRVGTDPVGDEVCPASGPGGPDIILTTGARIKTTERGIRWANVPDGRADFVVHRSQRVWHVSTPMLLLDRPVHVEHISQRGGAPGPMSGHDIGGGGVGSGYDGYSGAIKYRFRDYRSFNVPNVINPKETRNNDRYGNPIFGGATGIDNSVHIPPQGHILDGNAEALWRFDEAAASDDLTDIANSHTVLQFGNPVVDPGQIDSARRTNNTQRFQGLGNAAFGLALSGNFTVEQWVNPDHHAASSNMFIYNGLNFSFDPNHTILAETQYDITNFVGGNQGQILFHQWHNQASLTEMVSSGSIVSGSWSHYALVRESQGHDNLHTFSIYINGVLDSTFPNISGLDFNVSGSGHFIGLGNYIGANGFGLITSVGNPFYGKMDDTRISKVARSPSEILDSYNRGIGT